MSVAAHRSKTPAVPLVGLKAGHVRGGEVGRQDDLQTRETLGKCNKKEKGR